MDTVTSLARAGRTRKELRRMIGTRLGDLKTLRATASSETSAVFADRINLTKSTDSYAGQTAYFCGGQTLLLGVEAYVQSSSASAHMLTFSESLPVEPALGDEVHLINWSGVGFTIDDYHNTINDVILSIGESHFFVPMAIAIDQSYNETTNTIQLPSELRFIENLDTNYGGYGWQHLTKARPSGTDGWYVDRASAQVVLLPWSRTTGTKPDIRITGYGVPPLLENDTDTCAVPAEWFIEECAARMLEKNITQNPGVGNRDRVYNMLRQHADAIRPINGVRMDSFVERVF